MTFRELNELFLHATSHNHPASYVKYRQLYAQFFSTWTEHPTNEQVRAFYKSRKATPAHATKALTYLSAMYSWAADPEEHGRTLLWTGENPAKGVRRFDTKSRTRTMHQREVDKFVDNLSLIYLKIQVLLVLLLTTGARLSEALEAKWEHLNLEMGSWYKPKTKNGTSQLVPLPRQTCVALSLLSREGAYVFAGMYDRHLSRTAAEKWWHIWRKRLGFQDLNLHDLRRTLCSRLLDQGESPTISKTILNHHIKGNVDLVYERASFDTQARALQTHADGLFAARRLYVDQTVLPTVPLFSADDGFRRGEESVRGGLLAAARV